MTNQQRLESLITRKEIVQTSIEPKFSNTKELESRSINQLVFKDTSGEKIKPSKLLLAKLNGKYEDVIRNKRQATMYDISTYINPLRMLNLIKDQKFSELSANNREQYQSFVQRPWWGLQKYLITEWFYPNRTIAQKYSEAERKYQNNKKCEIHGGAKEDITNQELAFAKLMELQYTELATEAKLLENGNYLVTKKNYFWRPGLSLGIEISKDDMRDGALVLTGGDRMKEGELSEDVIGRHNNWITNTFNSTLSVLPIPFFKIRKGGGH